MKFLIWDDDACAEMCESEIVAPDWTVEASSAQAAVDSLIGQLGTCERVIVFDGATFRELRIETTRTVMLGAPTTLTEMMGGETDHADLLEKLRQMQAAAT
jgi:hypothetical protein